MYKPTEIHNFSFCSIHLQAKNNKQYQFIENPCKITESTRFQKKTGFHKKTEILHCFPTFSQNLQQIHKNNTKTTKNTKTTQKHTKHTKT